MYIESHWYFHIDWFIKSITHWCNWSHSQGIIIKLKQLNAYLFDKFVSFKEKIYEEVEKIYWTDTFWG